MNVGACGTYRVPRLPPCKCGHAVTVRYAERDGEGETYDPDENLVVCVGVYRGVD